MTTPRHIRLNAVYCAVDHRLNLKPGFERVNPRINVAVANKTAKEN